KAASTAGVSVNSAEIQQGVAAIAQQAEQYASQSGLPDPSAVLLSSGIPPQMINALGRYQAQELALAKQANGGKLPTTEAETNTASATLAKGDCQAAKTLNIRINPQYGQLDYSQYTVVDGTNVLSKAVGATPAPTPTATAPAC